MHINHIQLQLLFVESGNGITISTFTPGHINETSAAVAAMMYKRYEHEIEQARLKFKSEVEKNGYYAMNKNFKRSKNSMVLLNNFEFQHRQYR